MKRAIGHENVKARKAGQRYKDSINWRDTELYRFYMSIPQEEREKLKKEVLAEINSCSEKDV